MMKAFVKKFVDGLLISVIEPYPDCRVPLYMTSHSAEPPCGIHEPSRSLPCQTTRYPCSPALQPTVWGIYTVSTRYLHGIYTVSTRSLCAIYTVSTRYLHGIYTVSTRHLHGIHTVSTRHLHGIYAISTRYLHGIYTASTLYLHGINQ